MALRFIISLVIATLVLGEHVEHGAVPVESKNQELSSSLEDWREFWLFHLILNLIGYATIIVPGYFIIQYVKKNNYLAKAGPLCIPRVLRMCILGPEEKLLEEGPGSSAAKPEKSEFQQAVTLVICFAGLQVSYLTWGVLQEKVMTKKYGNENFTDSQFLVFMNRVLAFVFAGTYILISRQPRHTAPMYKYSYASFSNIMSSWCQYEALKFVSFPTQVLAKASKIIPVMLMGKLVSKTTYQYYEYVTAVMISVGISMFLLSGAGDHGKRVETVTTFSGVIILLGYMVFDSFTSNWQGELFSTYKMSSVQMMCGVNLFSCLFTSVSLWEQGGFMTSVLFASRHVQFVVDICILSVCSATGQLFIFYTISQFGAVTFVIIMTIRQGLAILLSCLIYQHSLNFIGVIGVLVVFFAIFLKIYCGHRIRQLKLIEAKKAAPPLSNV